MQPTNEQLHGSQTYYGVFLALAALTGLTIWVSDLEIGRAWGFIVAMAIASCKATMVGLYFMHLKFEVRSIYIVIAVPAVLTLVLIGMLTPDIGGLGR